MKAITIRERHEKTGQWVPVHDLGEIHVTNRGRTVVKVVPQVEGSTVTYFAHRKLSPAFRAIMDELHGGTDSTQIIIAPSDTAIHEFAREIADGAYRWLPLTAVIFERVQHAYRKLPALVFLRDARRTSVGRLPTRFDDSTN